MGGLRRGYITFLLLTQWSFLLLLPYLLAPATPSSSLLPAYSATRALSEQVAFSRAARAAASQAFSQIKTDEESVKLLAAAAGIPPQSYDELTQPQQEQLARAAILQSWASLSNDWSSQSDFQARIYCEPIDGLTSTSPSLRSNNPPLPTSLVPCADFLHLSPDSQRLTISPGVQIQVRHRPLPVQMSGELAPTELGR